MAIKGGRPADRRAVPHLMVNDGKAAVEFYKTAFGAKVLFQSPMPHGDGIHAQMQVGDSIVMISDWRIQQPDVNLASPQSLGGTSTILEMYVENVDDSYNRALDAGATSKMPPANTFFGDRYCWVMDPFGHLWALATVLEELTEQQVKERMEAVLAQSQKKD